MSTTGAGAGGSAAAGTEAERVGGRQSVAVQPVQEPGFMAPVNSSGSGGGDRGHPLDPTQPVVPSNAAYVTQPIYPDPQQYPPNVRVNKR